ncbi:MAG: LysM peptidoglycan-binding domain-containing protein [Flammeovirgaceae bacterium]
MNGKTTILTTILLLFSLVSVAEIHLRDSIGTEEEYGKTYILHKVTPQESMTSIAKKYNVTLRDMMNANPYLKEDALQIGQIVRVPSESLYAGREHLVTITHTVAAGETLYGIAKKYNVKVEEIKLLNKLKSNTLYKHQALLILVPGKNPPLKKTNNRINDGSGDSGSINGTGSGSGEVPWWVYEPIGEKNARVLQVAHTIQPGETLEKIAKEYGVSMSKLVTWNAMASPNSIKAGDRIIVGYEYIDKTTGNKTYVDISDERKTVADKNEHLMSTNGRVMDNHIPTNRKITVMGAVIKGNSETSTNKHLALHRTAAKGSYIKVTNPNNGKSTFVRILGNLQNVDTDKDVIIKISRSACQSIGLVTDKFPVILEYNQ